MHEVWFAGNHSDIGGGNIVNNQPHMLSNVTLHWMVREAGLPFREAHHVTGRTVKLAEERGVALDALPLADLQAIDPRITASVYDVLTVDASVRSRTSFGGTAPANVRAAIAAARDQLA